MQTNIRKRELKGTPTTRKKNNWRLESYKLEELVEDEVSVTIISSILETPACKNRV